MAGLFIEPGDEGDTPMHDPGPAVLPPPALNAIPTPQNMALFNGMVLALKAHSAGLEYKAEADRIARAFLALKGEPEEVCAILTRDVLALVAREPELMEIHDNAHRHRRLYATHPGAIIEVADALQLHRILDRVVTMHAEAHEALIDAFTVVRQRKIAQAVRQAEADAELAEMLS